MDIAPETACLDAVRAHLKAFTDARGLRVTLPNRSKDEPDTPYLDVTHYGVPRGPISLGTLRRVEGIFQVTVVVDIGTGDGEANALAGGLASHFGAQVALDGDGASVTLGPPTVRTPYIDQGAYRTPVTVPYFSFYRQPEIVGPRAFSAAFSEAFA